MPYYVWYSTRIMKVYLIRFKNATHERCYVGKKQPTYAISSDDDLERFRGETPWAKACQGDPEDPPHWFVRRKYARLYRSPSAIKQIVGLCRSTWNPEFIDLGNETVTRPDKSSFSNYEVEVDDGEVTVVDLDTFLANPKDYE
jgi:hypothetical protein